MSDRGHFARRSRKVRGATAVLGSVAVVTLVALGAVTTSAQATGTAASRTAATAPGTRATAAVTEDVRYERAGDRVADASTGFWCHGNALPVGYRGFLQDAEAERQVFAKCAASSVVDYDQPVLRTLDGFVRTSLVRTTQALECRDGTVVAQYLRGGDYHQVLCTGLEVADTTGGFVSVVAVTPPGGEVIVTPKFFFGTEYEQDWANDASCPEHHVITEVIPADEDGAVMRFGCSTLEVRGT